MNVFPISSGDLEPVLTDTLLDADGVAVDLTGCTVRFLMWGADGTLKIDAPATVTGNPVDGGLQYTWVGTDTDEVGTWPSQWLVTRPDTKRFHAPTKGYVMIEIQRSVGDDV